MIPLEKLQAVTRAICHGPSCPDGIASALIIRDSLPDVRVSFMNYGEKAHRELAAEPGLLFCDFTPVRERVAEFVAAGSICLDHHPTARDIVEAFGELGVFGLNERGESGAWLAYEQVWAPTYEAEGGSLDDDYVSRDVKNFAWRAAVRDTWKTSHQDWDLACEEAALRVFWHMAQPVEYYTNDSEYEKSARKILGARLAERQLESAHAAIEEARRFTTSRGTRVLMFQGTFATSDAAEILETWERKIVVRPGVGTVSDEKKEDATNVVAGFHYKVDDGKLKLQFSTRSHTGYDVGAFAKSKPGGGGHAAAAGFTVEVSPEIGANPYAIFRLLLEEWESGQ